MVGELTLRQLLRWFAEGLPCLLYGSVQLFNKRVEQFILDHKL